MMSPCQLDMLHTLEERITTKDNRPRIKTKLWYVTCTRTKQAWSIGVRWPDENPKIFKVCENCTERNNHGT